MAHNLTSTDSALFARVPAWHKLGKVFPGDPTPREALELSGLGWNVEPFPVYVGAPSDVVPEKTGSHKGLRRSDNGDLLGIVGAEYGIVQNRELFDLVGELHSDVRIESAFSMYGGRKVVVVAQLRASGEVVEGDRVDRYCMIQTAHDGSSSIHVAPTAVRVVCGNTWRLALGRAEREGVLWKVRHTRNAQTRVAEALRLIRQANELFEGDVALARQLAAFEATPSAFEAYLEDVLPIASGAAPATKTRALEARADVRRRFRGPLQSLPGMSRSWWAAFNAVTEYVDHGPTAYARGSTMRERTESDVRRRIMGSGTELKAQAWKGAVAAAGLAVVG